MHIFQQEQEEYQSEGIHWLKIDFNNNHECVDLLEKVPNRMSTLLEALTTSITGVGNVQRPMGILPLLTEECRFPKGTDHSFLAKINSANAHNRFFLKPRPDK